MDGSHIVSGSYIYFEYTNNENFGSKNTKQSLCLITSNSAYLCTKECFLLIGVGEVNYPLALRWNQLIPVSNIYKEFIHKDVPP